MDIVASWLDSGQPWPPLIYALSASNCAAVFTVSNEFAARLADSVVQTPLGPVTVKKKGPEEALFPAPEHKDPEPSFFATVFPRRQTPQGQLPL